MCLSYSVGYSIRSQHNEKPMYYKLLRTDMTHHDFQYKEGWNVLDRPFCPDEWSPDGLYFSEGDDVWTWVHLYDDIYWIADVTFSDDAEVVRFEEKLKADRIFLSNIRPIAEFLRDPAEQYKAVAKNGAVIRFMNPQSPELCLAAVTQCPTYFVYVLQQTPTLCTLAVEKDPFMIHYVKDQTPALCEKAVRRNPLCLHLIREQTEELCLMAVRKNGTALKCVRNPTPEIISAALNQNGVALQYVKDKTPELCATAVRSNSIAIRFVPEPTPELCMEAIRICPLSIKDIRNPTPEVYEFAVQQIPDSLKYMLEPYTAKIIGENTNI